jgi:hypothetical protein
MEYPGAPMSALLRTNDITKIEGAEDNNTWGYMPLWPGGFTNPLPHTPEITLQLKAEGYEEYAQRAFMPVLASMGYELQATEEGNGTVHDWARGPFPVGSATMTMLCFSISNCPPDDTQYVAMLNPLPVPQHGEKALVFDRGTAKFHPYHISQLPENARELRAAIRAKIEALSSPALWPQFTERHHLASDPVKYRQALDTLFTRKMLLAGNPKRYEQTVIQEAQLGAAQAHIRDLKVLLNKPSFKADWKELQAMMYQLAQAYGAYHDEVAQKQAPAQASPKHLPEDAPPVINPFIDGRGLIPSPGPMQAIIESLENAASGADRWQRPEKQPPYYTFSRQGGQTIVEYGRKETTTVLEDSVTRGLWEGVKKLSDYDADVLLGVFAQIIKNDGAPAWFWPSQFLDYRGVVPIMKDQNTPQERRAGHRIERIQEVLDALYKMSNLWVRIEEIREPKRKGKKPRKFVHSGRVFMIGETWTQEGLDLAYEDGAQLQREIKALRCTPGEWLKEYLDAPRMVAFLADKILRYDPYREMWEKRLARYFMFHLRINAKHNSAVITRRIGLLFHDMSLPVDDRHPERTRARFEKAMNRLVEDKQIDAWQYHEEINLPARKWFDQWQELSIDVYTKAQLKEDCNVQLDKA